MGRMNGEDFIFRRVTPAENHGSGREERGGERGMKLEPKCSEDRSPWRPNLKGETGTGVRRGGRRWVAVATKPESGNRNRRPLRRTEIGRRGDQSGNRRPKTGGRTAESGVPHMQGGDVLDRLFLKKRPKTEFVMSGFTVTNSCPLILRNLLTTKAR
jgi:hypothetical protein